MKAQEVPVEIRLWATRPENHLIRIPVAEEGVIVAYHPESEDDAPMLLVDGLAYAPWTEDAFAAIWLVPTEPTNEEAELLRAATEAGYCIEPRVVGKQWRDIKRFDTRSQFQLKGTSALLLPVPGDDGACRGKMAYSRYSRWLAQSRDHRGHRHYRG